MVRTICSNDKEEDAEFDVDMLI